jgi:glycosyltransferase involved in cell wall biosynthesis
MKKPIKKTLTLIKEQGFRKTFLYITSRYMNQKFIIPNNINTVLKRIGTLNYSGEDLAENEKLMHSFSKTKNIDIQSINWLLPTFTHPYYGGIYTILRFANYYSEVKNIQNRLIIYDDPSTSSKEIRKRVFKAFPTLAEQDIIIYKNRKGDLPFADISIATLWPSAYFLLKIRNTLGKFYFIQDYEPLFYPAGSLYGLAEATYRFGFYGIINTHGLYEFMLNNYQMNADFFVPCIDKNIFYPAVKNVPRKPSDRIRIFFYARPLNERNAFELGIAAIKEIKKKFGDKVEIVTAGENWNSKKYGASFINNLGVLNYKETADLYRKCDIGLVFMYTKHPSYLPFELMACGCIVLTNYNISNTWLLKDSFNCLITEPSPSCISEKVDLVINNSSLRESIRKNALTTLDKYSWDTEMEKIYNFLARKTIL